MFAQCGNALPCKIQHFARLIRHNGNITSGYIGCPLKAMVLELHLFRVVRVQLQRRHAIYSPPLKLHSNKGLRGRP